MPTGIIHQTDLFRPYNDPDDHWDLATVYALTARGALSLRGVLIDAPPAPRFNPDLEAVAQMNILHHCTVPCAVGSSRPLATHAETLEGRDGPDRAGAQWLLEALEASPDPVVITIVGSCRDVALAANTDPDLFGRQCAAVYLNAGYGAPQLAEDWDLEYNVQRDVAAYRAMFKLPCPLYWLPCFEDTRRGEVTEWGTLWWFRQGEILLHLPTSLQRYFAYALGNRQQPGWLQYLSHGDHEDAIEALAADVRSMWSTAGFFHAAGMAVGSSGEIAPSGSEGIDPVFEFVPVRVQCSEGGLTRWEYHDESTNHWLFHIRHPGRYAQAMTRALANLLRSGGDLHTKR